MLNLSKLSHPVHWSEGLLMSPQHFQQADYFAQQLITHQLQRVSRFYWGVIDARISEIEFAAGTISLSALHCVFPDGAVVQFEADDVENVVASRGIGAVNLVLGDLDVPAGQSFTVSLALAKYGPGCASDEDSDLKRFASVNEGLVADIGDVLNQVDVVKLQPLVRLVLEAKSSPNVSVMPLFKVEKMLDDSFRFKAFTPPQLCVSNDYQVNGVAVWNRIWTIVSKARAKAVELRSLLTDKRSEEVVLEQQRRRIIVLSSSLLGVEAKLEAECHPFDVYCALLDYAGQVAAIREDPVPPKFRRYVHNDLDGTFGPLLDFIEETIESVRVDYSIAQFSLDEDGNFVGSIASRRAGNEILLSFQVPAGRSKDEVGLWVENAYICEAARYQELEISRDLGLTRSRVQKYPPLDLIESGKEVLFVVSAENQAPTQLLISGSNIALEASKPSLILSFMRRSD